MKNSKCISLLKTLINRDILNFEEYVKGLYPNKKVIRKLLRHLIALYPDFQKKYLEKEFIHNKLFKKEEYRPKKIIDAFSDLYLLLEEYLLWKEIKYSALEREISLIQIFRHHQFDKERMRKISRVQNKLNGIQNKSEYEHLSQILLDLEKFHYPEESSIQSKEEYLESISNHLDSFYLQFKLKLIIERKSRKNIVKAKSDLLMTPQVLELSKTELFDDNLSIQICRLLYDLLDTENHSIYLELKQILLKHNEREKLNSNDSQSLLLYLINFLTSQIKKGNSEYFNEIFELYEVGLESKVLLSQGRITSVRFMNIVDVASKLRKFAWASEFINRYRKYLKPNEKKDILNISKARLYFAQEGYEQTIDFLKEVKFKNFYYSFKARSLLLRSFIELQQATNLILDFCNSFERYVRRRKLVSKDFMTSYLNFIKISRLLINKKKTNTQILKEVNKIKIIICKDWILQYIEKRDEV